MIKIKILRSSILISIRHSPYIGDSIRSLINKYLRYGVTPRLIALYNHEIHVYKYFQYPTVKDFMVY